MRRTITATICLLLAATLSAETLYLKDGRVISGRIVSQNPLSVSVQTAKGTELIPKDKIARITFFSPEEEAERVRKAEMDRARQRFFAEKAELERVRFTYLSQQGRARSARLAKIRELVRSGKMEKPDEPISYWDFAWRSLVLPGWGHFYLKKPVIGGFYMGLTAAALVNFASVRSSALKAADTSKQAIIQNAVVSTAFSNDSSTLPLRLALITDTTRNQTTNYKKRIDRNNYSLALLAGVYGLQLIHIMWNGFLWEDGLVVDRTAPTEESSVQFALVPFSENKDKGIVAGFTIAF